MLLSLFIYIHIPITVVCVEVVASDFYFDFDFHDDYFMWLRVFIVSSSACHKIKFLALMLCSAPSEISELYWMDWMLGDTQSEQKAQY